MRPNERPTYCYVSSAEAGEIAVFELTPTGRLARVQTLAFGAIVMPMAVGADERILYAMLRTPPWRVAALVIDADTGRLSELATSPMPANMAYIGFDASRHFLLGVAYGEALLSVSPISADGSVGAPVALRPTAPRPHAVVADRSNRWLLTTSLADNTITRWRFDTASGELGASEAVAMATEGGPRHLALSADNRRVYAINERDGKVEILRFNAESGELSSERSANVFPGRALEPAQGADIHLTPCGRFLFASERVSSTITGYRLGDGGAIDLIGHFPTALQPRGFNVDPHGSHLVVAGQRGDAITVHRIAEGSGFLTEVETLPVGKGPNWVEFARP